MDREKWTSSGTSLSLSSRRRARSIGMLNLKFIVKLSSVGEHNGWIGGGERPLHSYKSPKTITPQIEQQNTTVDQSL